MKKESNKVNGVLELFYFEFGKILQEQHILVKIQLDYELFDGFSQQMMNLMPLLIQNHKLLLKYIFFKKVKANEKKRNQTFDNIFPRRCLNLIY